MTEAIKFLDKSYTEEDLKGMTAEDLLSLRNLVASNLGVANIKTFKNHEVAVEQTMKALVKYDTTVKEEESGSDEKPAKVKKVKEPKERKLAKPAAAQFVKRPTKKMFSVMKMLKPFDGEEDRSHRSGNYRDGMMIIEAIEGEGTIPWDIYNWEKQGYVKVIEPEDDVYAERRAEWYKANGREDPDVTKLKQAEESKAEKAKREAEREAKKAEREAVKAEAEAAKTKAEAE